MMLITMMVMITATILTIANNNNNNTSWTINTFQMKAELFLKIINYGWCLRLWSHVLSNLNSSASKEMSLHHLLNIHFLFPVHTGVHSGTKSNFETLRLHYSEELSNYSLSNLSILSTFILFLIRMSCNFQIDRIKEECALKP